MTMVITIIMIFHDRYDQSTAEAFRAVQKSGEMVKVKSFLDFYKKYFKTESVLKYVLPKKNLIFCNKKSVKCFRPGSNRGPSVC